jgi:hypothetical protein
VATDDVAEFYEVEVVYETRPGESDQGAILCKGGDQPKEFWVPKSQIDSDSEVYKAGTSGKLVVKRWWADKNLE